MRRDPRERLARLTGVSTAERALEHAAAALAGSARDNACGESPQALSDRYDAALSRFLALGGGDLDALRGRDLRGRAVRRPRPAVHGPLGREAARVSLAAVLLARADILLLDEPTNDLDEGARAARGVRRGLPGAIVLVSHDRAFLDRTVRRIAEIDPRSHAIVEWAGGWSDFERRRRGRAHAALP